MGMSAETAITAGSVERGNSDPTHSSRPLSLRALAEEIRRIEGGFGNAHLRRHIPTAIEPLDRQLAAGGLAAGALHELIALAPGGALRLWALWLARQASNTGGHILWLDSAADF